MFKILNGKADVLQYDSLRQIEIHCRDLATYQLVIERLREMEHATPKEAEKENAITQLRKDLDNLYATTWLGNSVKGGEK